MGYCPALIKLINLWIGIEKWSVYILNLHIALLKTILSNLQTGQGGTRVNKKRFITLIRELRAYYDQEMINRPTQRTAGTVLPKRNNNVLE